MRTRHPHSQPQRGLTLVEAAVVTVIAAIAVSSVAPGFQGFIEKQRLVGAAAQLATDLQYARAEAVLRHTGLRFSVKSAAWGQCYIVHTGDADQCACSADGPAQCSGAAQALRSARFTAADSIALQANVGSIRFDPLHGTCTPTGTLKLVAASGRAVHQVVNLMGRVRTCSPNGAVSGHASC
jgi:type IV fimbrial biogenesis protein FimT